MKSSFSGHTKVEAGLDEAGRGCLAGPVVAAAIVLPQGFYHPWLRDSKQMKESHRQQLREILTKEAIAFGIGMVPPSRIDEINILQATFEAMHLALDQMMTRPDLLLVDGNRFSPYKNIEHLCIIKGDAQYTSIAAASVLAKTTRDEWMQNLHGEFPQYLWNQNKGYPTLQHKRSIQQHGLSPHHRLTFRHALKDKS
jgi:ribonuclease HII